MFTIEVDKGQDKTNTLHWCVYNLGNRFKYHFEFDDLIWHLHLSFYEEKDYIWFLLNQHNVK